VQTSRENDLSRIILHAHAMVKVEHRRPYDFDEKRGLYLFKKVDEDEEVHNIVTDAGLVLIHTYAYGTSSRTNGLNYIALTNDSGTPAHGDTSLTGELNNTYGLGRVQGSVTLPTGTGTQTTIANTFTYTGTSQAVQKSALFNASSSGVMAHEVAWTQRTLLNLDTLALTYTITIS